MSVPTIVSAVSVVSPSIVPPFSLIDLFVPKINKSPDMLRETPYASVVIEELFVPSVIEIASVVDIADVLMSMTDVGVVVPMPIADVVFNLESVPVRVILS